ncbi:unnamed protein product [Durusdinium trenchii]|uniref:Uncharacterized protein n=2 Tax=Durusdinium trenchii TaxID=1381693 RepID=A0ABP0HDP0_9DINO
MSDDECTMPQACWASLMLALLEQDCASSGQANCSDKGFAATPAEHCGPFSIEEDKDQSDANIAGNLPPGSPKCHKMTASPEATAPIMEETCADSFLSETTAQAGHFGESPGAIDANQSFQTDGASRIAFNSPFVDETFSTPGVREHSRAGCATSFVSVAAADLARQHLEWVQELESVDQKQVDLMMTQWKLLRSQTGMLAQQLIDMRKEVDQIKQEQHKTTQHLEQQNLQSRELQHRLGAMLQQSVEETHMSMARMRTEVQKRASQDSEMRRRLQSLESWTSTTFPRFESEISELHSAVDVSVKQVTQLKDQLLQQVDDWKSGHGLVIEHSTKLHDRMRKGLRALMTAHETHRDEVQQAHKVLLERCEQQLESKLQEAERLRCQHPASPLALKAEKNKVMIKMTEKKKLRLKEPLNSPGGEGAGQKRSGGNGRASTLGDLDLAEKGVPEYSGEDDRDGLKAKGYIRKVLKKTANQDIRDFNQEFDRQISRLREVGCTLPDNCLAWWYVDKMRLDNATELNLLSSVGNLYNLQKLQDAAIIQDRMNRRLWERRPDGDKRTEEKRKGHQALMTTLDEDDEDNEEPGLSDIEEEEFIDDEHTHEAFVAFRTPRASTGQL